MRVIGVTRHRGRVVDGSLAGTMAHNPWSWVRWMASSAVSARAGMQRVVECASLAASQATTSATVAPQARVQKTRRRGSEQPRYEFRFHGT